VVCQVPHLDDDDEKAWVFDTVSKKHHIHRIFTAMNGSVIASETAGASGKKRKAAAVPKATVDRRPGTHEPYKMIAFAGIFGMLEIRLAKVWLNPTCCKFRLKLVV
jgi:hypothetical protein